MQCLDIYLRRVDASGLRKPVITHHRVWDRAMFLAEQERMARDASAKDPRDGYRVELATAEEYAAANPRRQA